MLIIDDDETFIDLLRATLGLHDVRIARTLKEAWTMIDQSAPDVILLDLTLPDSPLAQTIERINEIKTRAKDATVIVITGHPDVAKLQAAAIHAGAHTILSKDNGFFSSLSDALVSTHKFTRPCAAQDIVERIEATVGKIVGSNPPM